LLLDVVPLENRVGLESIHSKNAGELKMVELALPEKLHGIRFLRVRIEIRILLTEPFFNILGQFESDRHAKSITRAWKFVHVPLSGTVWYEFGMDGSDGEMTELLLSIELLRSKIERLEAARPVTYDEARCFADLYSVRLHRRYTVARVCRNWGISKATLYRHLHLAKQTATGGRCQRLLDDAEIAARLREMIANSPFPAERHRKLWARLRRAGIEVSRERVRRIIREFAVLPAPGGGIVMPRPDMMWGIDSTDVCTDDDGWPAACGGVCGAGKGPSSR
jgi:transposase-like protein